MHTISCLLTLAMLLSGCAAPLQATQMRATIETPAPPVETGWIRELVLDSAEGQIHYSYYLPEGYDPDKSYPMVIAMPGYGDMWFGEDSSGRNLNWSGAQVWTQMDEDMIVVSAQLTDWGETSARQANELTEHFLQNFSVDASRVYATGYSAGGETMSRAVALRPDLYAAYLHGASQWDGTYAPVAEEQVAVYIFMAEHDEYYGSQRARDAYDALYAAYRDTGASDEEIHALLQLEIPDDAYFNALGIYNYHGGGNVLYDEERILDWILSARKPKSGDTQSTGFSDVEENAWYADAVEYVRDSGLMSGTSDSTFSPDTATSRAMLTAILYRASGSPAVSSSPEFADVAADAYYADAVVWAVNNGIVSGYGNGRFGANDPVSREQLATILWRYAGSPAADVGQDFADESSISSYAAAAVDWARANGIVNGMNGNRFNPDGNATRAQVAVILHNYMEAAIKL